ncbi:hypothetical protein B0T10DRAFT_533100 [Thelonectria olida]|uniref:Zn(2)-C6 fungal-type domain-containing protein n=1 Tax=Thelonectria olida TaxID=1576542 RepID=A0A9P8VSR1_9HYPO|nr:hypothetical protein B0T10DRAFT_533100 [Thelonectria olida]
MKRSLGPLDKRKRLSRCQPCAKRRIKCQGGLPCEYCIRTKKSCVPQTAPTDKLQFVRCTPSQQASQAVELPVQVDRQADLLYFDYFALFIKRCEFTQDFASVTCALLPLTETCPPLREAVIAIGALDASRRSHVRTCSQRQLPHSIAFRSYGTSIRNLQHLLQASGALQSDGVLWCTFLLGLFELMSETSGERWVKHMLYGTSRIVQSLGPTAQTGQLRSRLFEAFRQLEANRAVLYGEDTFLSQAMWLKCHNHLAPSLADPIETGLGALVRMASFSKRFFDHIESIPQELRPGHPIIHELANEGMRIRRQLQCWHDHATLHPDRLNSYLNLALTNYHALALFLCRNYTFYNCWDEQQIPQLTTDDVSTHVDAVLALSEAILKVSSIPGLLLLFPLRMAGASAIAACQRDQTSRLLARVSQNGFLISERVKADLHELWAHERLRSNVELSQEVF